MKQLKSLLSLRSTRAMLYAVLLGLLVWLIVREPDSFQDALRIVRHADFNWLVVGIIAMAVSLPGTALVYMALSPNRLRFGRTVLVQMAGFCVNKLLPSGSGAIGTSFLYLRANKVPGVQAGTVVVLNNLLGLVGHFLLFWVLMALEPSALHDLAFKSGNSRRWAGLALCAVIAVIGLTIVFRERLWPLTSKLQPLLKRPGAFSKALTASMLITLCYVVSLYASAHAVGGHISLAAAIIVLSSSVLATSVVPTPGGIGAAEAGAYGGLVAIGINHETALAAALLYRVCTFWLPLLFGSVAFVTVIKRGYLRTSPS